MEKIIEFKKIARDGGEVEFTYNATTREEDPDLDTMSREELEGYLHKLEDQLAQLDGREPKNQESEAYEDWADEHEDLEDQIDEVLDLLDEMG